MTCHHLQFRSEWMQDGYVRDVQDWQRGRGSAVDELGIGRSDVDGRK